MDCWIVGERGNPTTPISINPLIQQSASIQLASLRLCVLALNWFMLLVNLRHLEAHEIHLGGELAAAVVLASALGDVVLRLGDPRVRVTGEAS